MRIRPRSIILVTFVCAAGLLFSLSGPASADDGPPPRQRSGSRKRKPRPASLIGTQIRVIDDAGMKSLLARGTPPQDRPLLLNFWATWCDPCREEFPDLVKIDSDYRSKGLDFVAISLDDLTDMKTAVPRFLRSQRAKMPVFLLDVPDPQTIIELVDPTWQGDMPATFLYDRSGTMVYKYKGPIKPAELRTEIDKVLMQGTTLQGARFQNR
jgi:thiol-disulfide isomerase/thioredoxin